MARDLLADAWNLLTEREAGFCAQAARRLELGLPLSPPQKEWLRDLHARYAAGEAGDGS